MKQLNKVTNGWYEVEIDGVLYKVVKKGSKYVISKKTGVFCDDILDAQNLKQALSKILTFHYN